MRLNLKRIYVPNDNMEATIIKDALEENGIYCFIQGDQHRSMLGFLGTYIDLGVMVPENQVEEAAIIVENVLSAMEILPMEPTDGDINPESEKVLKPHKKIRQKSKRVAFFLPFVLPGAGSCYAGNPDIGVWIIGSYLACLVLFCLLFSSAQQIYMRYLFLFVAFLFALDWFVALKALKKQRNSQ